MKNLLKLCLLFGLFCMTTPMFAQVPDPTGIDYCDCLDGVQTIHDECNCTSTGGNTGTNNGGSTTTTTTNTNTNTGSGGPTTTGGSTGGGDAGTAYGNFPLVFSWLDCFFDPDCTP